MQVVRWAPYLLIIIGYFQSSFSDQSDYSDTNAVTNNEGNIDISDPVRVKLSIITSHTYLAGTTDVIQASFVGDFSSSGPHNIANNFVQGKKATITLTISRTIGKLKEIVFYNYGHDGWLPADVSCQINNQLYILSSHQQWVDSLDPILFKTSENGYENDQYLLPAASSIHLNVLESIQMYSLNGDQQLLWEVKCIALVYAAFRDEYTWLKDRIINDMKPYYFTSILWLHSLGVGTPRTLLHGHNSFSFMCPVLAILLAPARVQGWWWCAYTYSASQRTVPIDAVLLASSYWVPGHLVSPMQFLVRLASLGRRATWNQT